jgi:hypothetical protein
MNDNRSTLFSASLHNPFQQARFAARARGRTSPEASSHSAHGPDQKSLPTPIEAPIHALTVGAFRKRPDLRKSHAIQFP